MKLLFIAQVESVQDLPVSHLNTLKDAFLEAMNPLQRIGDLNMQMYVNDNEYLQ